MIIEPGLKIKRSFEITRGENDKVDARRIADNFTSFENGRKYACYSGIAHFEKTSGKYKGKTKVSHLANKRVKVPFSNGANCTEMGS